MGFPLDMAGNGILLLYNQFPRCYPGGIAEMTQQLQQIKAMGFNAVWINPIQATGKKVVQRPVPVPGNDKKVVTDVSGSLYAMFDNNSFNPTFNVTEDLIKQYTETARGLRLVPLFDLVLNQVAIDDESPITIKFGNALAKKGTWDDTKWFDYNSQSKGEIIQFWKDYIRKYIVTYGFMGARVDAVKFLDPEIQRELYSYLDACVKERHGPSVQAVILGELLDPKPLSHLGAVKAVGLTHINNSSFSTNYSTYARRLDKKSQGWNHQNWLLHEIGELRVAIRPNNLLPDAIAGGTIGYTGNHDKCSLGQNIRKYAKSNDEQILMTKMKEKIMGVAFSSDAGWYALCGDEFGISYLSPLVFDNFKVEQGFQVKWGTNTTIDLRSFIAGVNHVLSLMPAAQPKDWVEHIVLDNNQDLAVVIRHSNNGTKNLICINLNNTIELQPANVITLLGNTAQGCTIHLIDKTKTHTRQLGQGQLITWDAPAFQPIVQQPNQNQVNPVVNSQI